MSASKPVTWAVAGIAAVVLAFGAYTIASNTSGSGASGTAAAAQPGASGQVPRSGQVPETGQLPQNGRAPTGFGTPATGSAAKKAAAAAVARYRGNVEQVMTLEDGSYVVHVITADGEYHVAVSKDFKVTGADQGGPRGAPGAPSQGATPGSTS